MRLLYMTSISYPSRLANRIQTIEMAKQFNRFIGDFVIGGCDIKNVLGIVRVKNFLGSRRSFFLGFKYAQFIRSNGISHVFSREDKLIFFTLVYLRIFGVPRPAMIFEAHDFPKFDSFIFNKVLKWTDKIIVLTNPAKEDLMKKGISANKILVSPDGVNPDLFDNPLRRDEARKRLSLTNDEHIVLYTGHLYDWKGVQTLADSAKYLLPKTRIYFVGGTEKDIENFRRKNNDNSAISIVGYVPPGDIPLWLWASDVLILPNSGKEKISSRYTSPLKLFEYMMAERPIVASDLPSLRDVLNPQNATFFTPDDPNALGKAISRVLGNKEEAMIKARKAREDASSYAWENRAKNIISFIS